MIKKNHKPIILKIIRQSLQLIYNFFSILDYAKIIYKFYSSNIKYVHIMVNEKFNNDYIEICNSNFKNHLFIIRKRMINDEIAYPKQNNVVITKRLFGAIFKFIAKKEIKKLFIHGIHVPDLINMLYKNQHILKKTSWMILSTDEITNLHLVPNWKIMKPQIIKNISSIMTFLPHEVDLINRIYNPTSMEWTRSFLYPSNVIPRNITIKQNVNPENLNIILGNSANINQNHEPIISILANHKDKINTITCPLSYSGTDQYRDKILKLGRETLEEKFIPLLKFISRSEYDKIIFNADIGILGYKEATKAFGNTVSLLSSGKTLYMYAENHIYKYMIELGFKIYNIDDIEKKGLKVLSYQESKENYNLAKDIFSQENLIKQLKEVFC